MRKVIFIPGMSGAKRDLFLFKKILREYDLVYFPYDVRLEKSIEEYSGQLKKFISRIGLKKNEKISVIAISAGGIIAMYCRKFLEENRIDRIITICSPFGGTWVGALFPKRKGTSQIKKGSQILEKIKKVKSDKSRNISIWCPFDPLVPGRSGEYENPKMTLFPLHWIVQFWPPAIMKVKNYLNS